MKKCHHCKIEKAEAEFNRKYDGLQPWCRECNRARSRKYYAENRDKHLIVVGDRNKKIKEHLRQCMWDYLSANPCVDCGESDPIVLEFDHVRGEKSNNISTMMQNSYSWTKVLAEIEKCDVRCSNCHKRKTANDFGWYKHQRKISPL